MIQMNRRPKDNHHQTASNRRVNGNSLGTNLGPPMFIQPGKENATTAWSFEMELGVQTIKRESLLGA